MNGGALALEGVVRAGLGEGARFTALGWFVEALRDALGFVPYPGTFNVEVRRPDRDALRAELRRAPGIAIAPPPGFCAARCFPADVEGRIHGAVVLPDVSGYPEDKLELVAPVCVREALGLGEGARVRVTVRLDARRHPGRARS